MMESLPSNDTCESIAHWLAGTEPVALVTVVSRCGSTPAPIAARMVVGRTGRRVGTIGGGRVEAIAISTAQAALESGDTTVLEHDLHGATASAADGICGGRMRIAIDATPQQYAHVFAMAADCCRRRQRGVLVTRVVNPSSPRIEYRFYPSNAFDDRQDEILRNACLTLFRPVYRVFADTQTEVMAEPVVPIPQVIIVGGGHVGHAVCQLANWLGFGVVVVEDRREFAVADRFPTGTNILCGPLPEMLASRVIDPQSYVVIATRSHTLDLAALELCLGQNAAYVGMIGSRRKVTMIRQQILSGGRFTSAELDRVFAPIGVDIGAVTVREIAVSIMAQIVQVHRDRGPQPQKDPAS